MTALTRQAYPAPINMHQMRNAQARTGTVNRNRLSLDRFSAAELDQMPWLEHRDRHRHGGEVIDDFQMRKTEVLFHLCNRECPGMVGHGDPVASYRAGNGNAAILDAHLMFIQIDADNGLKAGIIQPRVGFRPGNFTATYIA